MLLDFSKIEQRDVEGRNGGAVTITAKMYISELGKIISASIHAGGSSGLQILAITSTMCYREQERPFAMETRRFCTPGPAISAGRARNTALSILAARI